MDEPHIQNKGPMQGQIIGENQQITQNFGAVESETTLSAMRTMLLKPVLVVLMIALLISIPLGALILNQRHGEHSNNTPTPSIHNICQSVTNNSSSTHGNNNSTSQNGTNNSSSTNGNNNTTSENGTSNSSSINGNNNIVRIGDPDCSSSKP